MRRVVHFLGSSFVCLLSLFYLFYGNIFKENHKHFREPQPLPTVKLKAEKEDYFPMIHKRIQNFDLTEVVIYKGLEVDFLPNFKNPCWYEYTDGKQVSQAYYDYDKPDAAAVQRSKRMEEKDFRLRCLPYFFLIGQPKCGTTDLFQRITLHPDVIPPIMKGPHWWTRRKYGKPFADHPVSFAEYLDYFDDAAFEIESKSVAAKEDSPFTQIYERITGDGSTSTLWDSGRTMEVLEEMFQRDGILEQELLSRRKSSANNASHSFQFKKEHLSYINEEVEGQNKIFNNLKNRIDTDEKIVLSAFTVADVIHSIIPNSRIIAVFREPVSRLYSSYFFFTKGNVSPEEFDKRVHHSIRLWDECAKVHNERSCAYNKTLIKHMSVRLYNGMYSIFLNDWLKVFPRSQVMVVRMEDYHGDITGTLASVSEHLGLRALTEAEKIELERIPVRNKSKKKQEARQMMNSTAQTLRDFYHKFNSNLAKLLQDDKFSWEDVYAMW